MSRALLIVQRRGGSLERLRLKLETLNRTLTPDNIEPRPARISFADGVATALFNPTRTTLQRGMSIAVGTLFEQCADWDEPGAALPEGTYGLMRVDAQCVELVADSTASRTIWYALTDDQLIASTSQRAIIAILGDFTLNRDVLPWLLSSGTLGPESGWDARLERVQAGERLTLDRATWTVAREVETPTFEIDDRLEPADHAARLVHTIDTVCRGWRFDPPRWVLPLSGGADSRGLLFLLHEREGLRTLTWGRGAARREQGNDAYVARTLAAVFGVSNRYFPADASEEPRPRLIRRFLAAGEGRVAKISGYLDGFQVWKTLFEDGVDGIIRGDEAFGSIVVRNAYGVRYTASLTLMSDYFGASDLAAFELPEQHIPESLAQRPDESLATWRDRLYQQFRIPTLLAALTDLKASYVEVANPFLSHAVLAYVRRLPDELRTGKRLWTEIVQRRRPDIPFARRPAVLALHGFLSDPAMLELMLGELETATAARLFAPALRELLCDALRAALAGPDSRERYKPLRPFPWIRDRMTAAAPPWLRLKPVLDPIVLAFRSFLAVQMVDLLTADAQARAAPYAQAVNL